MAIFLDKSQGIQYNDVLLGDFKKVSSAIINHESLIVRDSPEGSILDAADFFDSATESFTSLFKGRSDQKERVIAALNSFYTERHEELYYLGPSQIEGLYEGLEEMQRSMIHSPSFVQNDIPYIIDLSKKDHAAREETQRAVPSAICLSEAIDSVKKALDAVKNAEEKMKDNQPIQLVDADDDSAVEECFLLIEDAEEEVATPSQAQAPEPGLEEKAASLQAIFDGTSDRQPPKIDVPDQLFS